MTGRMPSPQKTSYFIDVPDHILQRIFSFIPSRIFHGMTVCHRFREQLLLAENITIHIRHGKEELVQSEAILRFKMAKVDLVLPGLESVRNSKFLTSLIKSKWTRLRIMDLSGNNFIRQPSTMFASDVRALPDLIARSTCLTDLVLSNNCLKHSGLRLRSILECRKTVECRQTLEHLRSLSLSNMSLSAEDFSFVAQLLDSCHSILHLDISRNCMCDRGALNLARGLKSCRQLVSLDMGGSCCKHNIIRSHVLEKVLVALSHCKSLERLSISYSTLNCSDFFLVARFLHAAQGLISLNLEGNCPQQPEMSNQHDISTGLAEVCKSLSLRANIQELWMGDNNIGTGSMNQFVSQMTRLLEQTRDLRVLNLSKPWTDSGPHVIIALAPYIGKCSSLTSLELSEFGDHRLGIDDFPLDEGGIAKENGSGITRLCEHLSLLTSLRSLTLAGNHIANGGALEHVLRSNKNITYLDLSGNYLLAQGSGSMARGLQTCVHLATLRLGSRLEKDWQSQNQEECAKVLEGISTSNLTELRIQNRLSSQSSCRRLSDILYLNRCLTCLDMSNNRIGWSGAETLSAHYLSSARHLRHLFLTGNHLGMMGIETIVSALCKSCPPLLHLDLSKNQAFKCKKKATGKNDMPGGIREQGVGEGGRGRSILCSIKRLLFHCPSLEVLDLSRNHSCTDTCKVALEQMLSSKGLPSDVVFFSYQNLNERHVVFR
ncbi:hypothetical protein GUITHDRAFT_141674 [Guillardia theta CCMP2712]|uniref:F-box domain-containing protein n=1 Tax=Guillardia theta (strain CCMP2712) TaxID=905079 RepID=L1J0V6_GUITC|nr:hypothetical protein GUITHDRAFT_141674 [Guillardia theta CCMP2712]EKX41937.1 hypothetical protein GUITHDRAFT_141674 [Guillardia theta CCMP2712]|eukprot:XP_005828917.1 hypothetical protein GUITHDRAFT_141674 [Guillardia theta CCMP2712]